MDAFLPAALVEIGAAFLLLAPLLLLERRIEDEVEAVRRDVEDTRADLVQTQTRLDALTPSGEVSEAVDRRLASSREEDEALFDHVVESPSSEAVRAALVRAVELGVVSRRMPRVRLFDTFYLVRFVPGATLDASATLDAVNGRSWLRVDLERDDGTVVHSFEWSEGMSAVDLGATIGHWLIERNQFPGDIAFQPGRMFDELKELLRLAHMRVSGARGVTVDLRPVQQLCGDEMTGDRWWITDVGVQQDGFMHTYTIPKERFGELDWDPPRDLETRSRRRGLSSSFRNGSRAARARLALSGRNRDHHVARSPHLATRSGDDPSDCRARSGARGGQVCARLRA